MFDIRKYPQALAVSQSAALTPEDYRRLYRQSVEDPDTFWAEQAKRLDWIKPWSSVQQCDLHTGKARWFDGAQLNVSYNCIDRHLAQRGEQPALLWEGDDPKDSKAITYRELHRQVCRLANAMKARGVKKGDRVCIYMPMIPEAAFAMLACTRIGAIHSVVFGGFSPDALRDRILDADCRTVITADEGVRGGKRIPLKQNVDKALANCPAVSSVLVVRRTGGDVAWAEGRDLWYHEATEAAGDDCPPEPMEAEDPLFILYTSGSTGKPKGVLHTTAGYLLQATMTFKVVFDYRDGEVFWCTADVGWVTGHSYIVYGPLANGAISLMFEGVPNYPDTSRFWQVVDKHQVNIFYTAPTALRALMREGSAPLQSTSRKSLRLLGSVGEPINPEAWMWYHRVIGGERCPIADTWWQTETGCIMISPLPGVTATKPGSCTRPLPGIVPEVVDDKGNLLEPNKGGLLVMTQPWPFMLRTLYGDHKRFIETYFGKIDGKYFAGDGARKDEDGYFWVMGRVDDVLNVSGHRLSTMEIESSLVSHPLVAEAAVVGFPHDLKGEGICCFVTPKAGTPDESQKKDLIAHVRKQIGALATPDQIRFTPALPKTRSGKIMRRLLRDIAAGKESVGDTTTLEDYTVLAKLREEE